MMRCTKLTGRMDDLQRAEGGWKKRRWNGGITKLRSWVELQKGSHCHLGGRGSQLPPTAATAAAMNT